MFVVHSKYLVGRTVGCETRRVRGNAYDLALIARRTGPLTTSSGLQLVATHSTRNAWKSSTRNYLQCGISDELNGSPAIHCGRPPATGFTKWPNRPGGQGRWSRLRFSLCRDCEREKATAGLAVARDEFSRAKADRIQSSRPISKKHEGPRPKGRVRQESQIGLRLHVPENLDDSAGRRWAEGSVLSTAVARRGVGGVFLDDYQLRMGIEQSRGLA